MKIRDVFRRPFDLAMVWLLLPFGLLGGGMAALPLRSWDYWWHIAFGRVISATHEMPLYAHFLYTMPADAPSYVQAWLSQWALFELHEALGLGGVLIIRNLFAAAAFTFLGMWAAKRAGSAPLGGILACAGAVFGFYTIAARTHLLAWPLFLVVLAIAYAVRRGTAGRRALVAIPLISVAWTNLHGTFLVPTLVMLAFFAAALADRVLPRPDAFGGAAPTGGALGALPWGVAGLASFAGTFANPRGHEIYLYLVDLPTNPENLTTVTEWFPTTPLFPPFFGAFFWFLLVTTLALMWRRRRALDWADLFLLLGFSLLAIQHSRGLMLVGLCFPVVAAPYVAPLARFFQPTAAEGPPSSISQTIALATAVALVLLPFVVQPWGVGDPLPAAVQAAPTRTEEPLKGLVLENTPIGPAQILRGRDDLRIFHDHQYPGFLLYWLDDEVPDQLVFVDNRVELPPDSIWRLYESVSEGRGWREAFARFEINAVVASKDNQAGLIAALREAPAWRLAFENDYHALFLPSEAP